MQMQDEPEGVWISEAHKTMITNCVNCNYELNVKDITRKRTHCHDCRKEIANVGKMRRYMRISEGVRRVAENGNYTDAQLSQEPKGYEEFVRLTGGYK